MTAPVFIGVYAPSGPNHLIREGEIETLCGRDATGWLRMGLVTDIGKWFCQRCTRAATKAKVSP